MIQDIAPHQYDITYCGQKAKSDSVLFVCSEKGILCGRKDGEIVYPTAGELGEMIPNICERAGFLFRIDGNSYFWLKEEGTPAFGPWSYLEPAKLRSVRPIWRAFAGITGWSLHKWYEGHQFCGGCGAKLRPSGMERAMECPQCKRVCYPTICPSVIVAVTDGERILLTKYSDSHSSYRNYALVAGYVETGESLEDTVRREVMEEVGLRVKNIRYYKSQPWPFSNALLAGFFCEIDGESKITMDRDELAVAEWFERTKIPAEHSEAIISLTGEMIEAFRDGAF